MMYDDKLVIVEMDTMTTYGFAEKGETADEAIQRANQYYTNDLKHLKASYPMLLTKYFHRSRTGRTDLLMKYILSCS